tara:strand:+ start:289 stop:519 length:231 start_codon:yes stop_codon:yes gene_type:complete
MNLRERIAKARQELHNRYSSVKPDQLPVSSKKPYHPGSLRNMILSDVSENQYASEQDNLSHQLKKRIQAIRKERGL